MYRLFFSLVLRHVSPERTHTLANRSLRLLTRSRPGRMLLRRLVGPTPPSVATHAFGLVFPSPLGVAAGVDKDASWFEELSALGFGHVEVGTITAHPQRGNPPPRIARFLEDRALLNRMGFPNPGAAVVARRLASRPPRPVVGVNVGKSMAASLEDAASDYRAAIMHLAPVADYLVLNVSSPNTPGLRELHAPERLRELIVNVRSELSTLNCARPLLMKVGPDLEDERLDAVAELALDLGLDGIVAVNTTTDLSGLRGAGAAAAALGGGGVSGAPLRARATEVLWRIRRVVGDDLVLISVGGVASAEDVWRRILAGATLVQVYTAFVYEGPGWPKRVNRELAQKVRDAGAASIQELVGTDARTQGEAAAESRKASRDSHTQRSDSR